MGGAMPALDLLLKILAAMLLGGLIGWQREVAHKPAGLRTHILIVLGATVVMDVSRFAAVTLGGDPTRMAANIVVGIGFIGAGTILREGPTVHGLTSAATIWVDGALGTVIGSGYYPAAILLTIATVIVLAFFGRLEALARWRGVVRRYRVITHQPDRAISLVREAVAASHLPTDMIDLHHEGPRLTMSFSLYDSQARHDALARSLQEVSDTLEIRSP